MKHRFVRFSSILALFLALVGMQLQCENLPGFLGDLGLGNVGSEGGIVRLVGPEGEVLAEAEIPAGALDETTTVSVRPLLESPFVAGDIDDVVGTAFQFGPDGTIFNTPVTITIFVPASELNGIDPDDLVIITTPLGAQAGLVPAAIDFEGTGDTSVTPSGDGFNVRGTISHFSPFQVACASCLGLGEGQPPTPGQDMVVYNDLNPFDNTRMGDANNVTMVRNIVNFTAAGSRVWADCSSAQNGLEPCNDATFSTFRGTIEGEGVTFEAAGDLTNIPADVRVIFLWTPTTPYTTAEINGLKGFAANGGRIVFVGEHDGFYTAINTVQNPFLDAMGSPATNKGGSLDAGTTVTTHITDPRHQITMNLTQVTIAASSAMTIGADDFPLYQDSSGTEDLSIVTKIDTTPIAPALSGALEAAGGNPTLPEAEALRRAAGIE